MSPPAITYKNHRFPSQIIARALWLHFRFPLSLRLVKEMLLERGIVVSYETIRRWGRKFGPTYAKQSRRKRASRKDIWHLDEGVISIAGRKHWLWRAVDQDAYVLDEIVRNRRNTKAATRLLVRLLKMQSLTPKRIITDKLRSYGAARRDVMSSVEHRSHKGLNDREENSHLPLRKRKRMMQWFRSVSSLQRFVSIFSAVRNLFVAPDQKRSALPTHIHRIRAMAQWNAVTAALVLVTCRVGFCLVNHFFARGGDRSPVFAFPSQQITFTGSECPTNWSKHQSGKARQSLYGVSWEHWSI